MRKVRLSWAGPIFIAAFLALVLLPSHKVFAHFEATSGTVDAELHIEPGDEAIAGKAISLNFIIDDASGNFQMANCSCNLSIYHGQRAIYSTSLSPPADGQATVYSASIPYTFLESGPYSLLLAGHSKTAATFQPFNLSWIITAHKQPSTSSFSVRTFLTYLAGIVLIFLVIGTIIYVLK